jgi:hypothetical protein
MAKNRFLCRVALIIPLSLAATAASAQSDPPGRVGRLSYMEGTVSFYSRDVNQWTPATLNYPVVAGASFWTEPGARAEIEVGAAEFRLDQTTLLDIVALDDDATRLELDQGVLNLHLHAVPQGGVEVATPLGVVDLVAAGSYHIDAGHGDPTTPPDRVEVTVLEGRAEVSGPRHRIEVFEGERAILAGDPLTITLAEGSAAPFDDWALQRERREQALATAQYVSPEATGYQDLDDYGRWDTSPSYGPIWYPTAVPDDWAPYRYGHWAWVPPWGWTWIDDAPWGFAPFHYGRWVEAEGRWGWCPGEVVRHPVYAPALVAFIGGTGWSVNIANGGTLPAVGWVPLAPHEVFHPYYRTSVTYVRQVNITNVRETDIRRITNVTVAERPQAAERFANHRAATVVPAEAFTHAAPVHRATLALQPDALRQAQVTPSIAHLRPTPAARAGVAAPHMAEAILPRPNVPATVARPAAAGPQTRVERREEPPPQAPGPRFGGQPLRPTPALVHPPQQPAAPPREAAPGRTQSPSAPAAPQPPQVVRPAPPAPTHMEAGPTHAPGAAPLRPAAPTAQMARPAPTVQVFRPAPPPTVAARAPRPPVVQIEHPVQQTRLAPTPQGWVRSPRPAAAPAHPAPHPAPGQEHTDHKPGG